MKNSDVNIPFIGIATVDSAYLYNGQISIAIKTNPGAENQFVVSNQFSTAAYSYKWFAFGIPT